MTMLTYREAARRVRRSVRTINRWRKAGLRMEWTIREGQQVRVVDEEVLLAYWRDRLDGWPTHQYRLRHLREECAGAGSTATVPISQHAQ